MKGNIEELAGRKSVGKKDDKPHLEVAKFRETS